IRKSTRGVTAMVVAGALLVTVAVTSAQRRNGGGGNSGVPVATETLIGNPAAYYGKVVTLSAGIGGEVVSTALLADQRKMVSPTQIAAIGKPVLVIAPELSSTPDQKHYVLMRGQVVKFAPAEIEKVLPGYRLDLPSAAAARFSGQPVLIASSVLNSVY